MSKLNLINFRDLAYLVNENGQHIKEGLIFRGPSLISRNLKEEDKPLIDDLKLKHIVDFRGIEEAEFHGFDYMPVGCIQANISALELEDKHNNPVELDKIEEKEHLRRIAWLKESYTKMPFNNPAYKYLIECIRNFEAPIYMHCSVGKDRTGVAAMIVLKLLGFKEEMILADYMLSKKNWLDFYAKVGKEEKDLSPMMLVREEWLLGSMKAIKDKYGNDETYFLKEYGIDQEELEKIRKYYLC